MLKLVEQQQRRICLQTQIASQRKMFYKGHGIDAAAPVETRPRLFPVAENLNPGGIVGAPLNEIGDHGPALVATFAPRMLAERKIRIHCCLGYPGGSRLRLLSFRSFGLGRLILQPSFATKPGLCQEGRW